MNERSERIGSTPLFGLPPDIRRELEFVDEDIAKIILDEMDGDTLRWAPGKAINLQIAKYLKRIAISLEKTHGRENGSNQS